MDFFSDRGFTMGLVAISLAFFVMFSFMFTQMLHFQLVRGHSAFDAALRFLWLPLGLMPSAANSDRLCERFGNNNVVSFGLSLIGVAMLVFTIRSLMTRLELVVRRMTLVGKLVGPSV
jgi:hypothetical protein